jgi:hypothetical protein
MNARVWCLRRARGASACSIKCSLMIRYPGDPAPPGALVSDALKVVLRYKWCWSPRTRTANYLSEGAPVSDSCSLCAHACSHRLRLHARPELRRPSTLPSFSAEPGIEWRGPCDGRHDRPTADHRVRSAGADCGARRAESSQRDVRSVVELRLPSIRGVPWHGPDHCDDA